MTYHSLSECTLTPDERVAEKDRILRSLLDRIAPTQLTQVERSFIWRMDGAKAVSVKQIFWLRDINGKY
jgi:hypothetical protein